jgi:hypothetical protein
MNKPNSKPAPIAHTAVKSSQIASVGYDAGSQTLEIKFKSGGRYRYAKVPPAVHADLMKAESIGKHFGAHVRGKFSHELMKD